MNDWRAVRHFGSSSAMKRCIIRPSAYALLLNDAGLLAVVRSKNGTFLPGGGIDGNETAEQAVTREAMEECGFQLRVGPCVNRAVQFVRSEARLKCLEKRSYFFEAEIEQQFPERIEPGHKTLWIASSDAHRYLTHESQAWVVSEWRGLDEA